MVLIMDMDELKLAESRNQKFYLLYEDSRGHYVDGRKIRPFLDWSPAHPDRPRWAEVEDGKILTYLDSELKPVWGSEF
jgi:hypothetical protein